MFHFGCGHRARDEVTLNFVALKRLENCKLLCGFDALGDDCHAKCMSHRNNRLKKNLSIFGIAQLDRKSAVDFKHVHFQFL